jgi:hypothetical protein
MGIEKSRTYSTQKHQFLFFAIESDTKFLLAAPGFPAGGPGREEVVIY